jgi:hypothetical protein
VCQKLESLAVLKILWDMPFFNILGNIFSDIPCLDHWQSIICTAIPCVLQSVSFVAILLCQFGVGVSGRA